MSDQSVKNGQSSLAGHADRRQSLRVGISSRALFDLEQENRIFEAEGSEAYDRHQVENEREPLSSGAAFQLIKGLLRLNQYLPNDGAVEVVVMSRNSPEVSIRIFESCKHHGLDIRMGAFTRGRPLSDYFTAYDVDLFLSKNEQDVQVAIDAGTPAALVLQLPKNEGSTRDDVRIAFDADCVLFSEESEYIFKTAGLDAFEAHEKEKSQLPLAPGPHERLLRALSKLQDALGTNRDKLRLAIVTARGSPAHERVIRTLRVWKIQIDEIFFMSGSSKHLVLEAFGADIFFDDQMKHLESASKIVPSGRVPYHTDSSLHKR